MKSRESLQFVDGRHSELARIDLLGGVKEKQRRWSRYVVLPPPSWNTVCTCFPQSVVSKMARVAMKSSCLALRLRAQTHKGTHK